MLVASSLAKQYPTPRGPLLILDDISLKVDRGQSVAIMGPSGCGKSTLLYMLGALEPPSSGSITIDGTNPYTLRENEVAAFRGAHIGFVFQDHLLLPQLTALENVLVPTLVARVRQGSGGQARSYTDRARELLTQVGLGDRLDHRPGELSGGERQRVAVARALIRNPGLVLCDEPTGNLDRAAAEGVADVLAGLSRDSRVILIVVTHSPVLASRFGQRYEVNNRQLTAVS